MLLASYMQLINAFFSYVGGAKQIGVGAVDGGQLGGVSARGRGKDAW